MRKSEFNEEYIQTLLENLPKAEDKRSKAEIWQNIELRRRRKERKTRIGPIIAAVCAVMLLLILSPSFLAQFSGQQGSSKLAGSPPHLEKKALPEKNISESSSDKSMVADKDQQESSSDSSAQKSSSKAPVSEDNAKSSEKTFVVPRDQQDKAVVVALQDQNVENIIPITLEGGSKQPKAEQITPLLRQVNAEALGFAPTELTKLNFKETSSDTVTVNAGKALSIESEAESFLKDLLEETFRWSGYKKAQLETDGHKGINFGQYGSLDILHISPEMKKGYFLFQPQPGKEKLFTPSRESFATVEDAIAGMKKAENHSQESLLAKDLPIKELQTAGKKLIISFSKHENVERTDKYILMLEGLLLTAKEFGYESVLFKNLKAEKIGRMDVTKPVEVPYSPNPVNWKD
ncbi:hypothetical protein LRR81_03715 [Metabacillus sp. GX 13764]|uniref:hypothetical protein n=1 Tax=Metabacillus kandeliae TaxID=2900151 RepID=UPI001E456383|nr:hypothetical protein [Metabacillus kandeliae]MCD7033325.1 hypothetical protein [Metabacillus kandeliae]